MRSKVLPYVFPKYFGYLVKCSFFILMFKSTFANTGMIAKSSLLRRIKTTKKEKCIYCNIKYLWILFPLSKYTIVNSDSPSLSSGCFFWPSLHKLGIFNKMYWKQIMFDIFLLILLFGSQHLKLIDTFCQHVSSSNKAKFHH